uniref:low-density lipoprotein receptor-related protein 1B-like n=1 Tax=Ciona intestinalis TaxID=7719 RepID=UPI000180C454|nr:low-density lipoprotein receptor-related protein 1B-like [Ciona intestinalis]|eukprot:XP_026692799.1 low-density lipoprotein receptor-related protein 1B-like [Ciona intestinalis]
MKLTILILICFLKVSVSQEVLLPGETECDCQREKQFCSRSGERVRGIYTDTQRCNGHNDCGDWSDERNCSHVCKSHNETACECHLNGTCDISNYVYYWPCFSEARRCNGKNDCGDWSDERNCTRICASHETECACNANGGTCPKFWGYHKHCYKNKYKCDDDRDCEDFSDETNCTCGTESVKCGCILNPNNCTSGLGCVEIKDLFDGKQHCKDFSDESCEIIKVNTRRTVPYYYPQSKEVIVTSAFLCHNASSYDYILKLNKTRPKGRSCKHIDFYSPDTFTYTETKWVCSYTYYIRNGFIQCEDKGWVIGPNLCNGFSDCADGTDELYDVPGFKCRAVNDYQQHKPSCVLPQKNLRNNNSYCEDKSDICYVDGKLKCFQCLDKKLLLSPMQVCDGVVDCYDASDECLCENQTICKEVLGESKEVCPIGQILCSGECLPNEQVTCNKSLNCGGGSNTKYCSKPNADDTVVRNGTGHIFCPTDRLGTIYTNATMCDGIPECYNREDECDVGCPNQTHFCDFSIRCHQKQATSIWEKRGQLFLHKRQYCDGIPIVYYDICSTGFDEVNCPGRYYCHNKTDLLFSIGESLLCDGVPDCNDGSDEWESICSASRFYCKNKQPLSVSRDRVENGIKDCSDGSDECPPVSSINHVFSSPFEMIGITFFRVIFWVMGFIALLGNIVVFTASVLELKTGVNSDPVKTSFLTFLINLSVSDSLMGIYLIAISGVGVQFTGSYCHHDAHWRSSSLCSFLGTLVIISTEVSALIMASMATFRLASVYFPIKMINAKQISYVIPSACAWVIGVLLACIPSMSQSGYFVNTLWFPNYFFAKQEVPKSKVVWLANRASQFVVNATAPKDWLEVKDTVTKVFKELELKGEFGYFSATSVCMPKLFVKTEGDEAWEYSTFLIVFNFILFIYIALAYACLFRRSNAVIKGSNKKSKKLLQTVSIMILCNFCCWIPICLMAFVSLSGVQLDNIVYVISAGILLPINSVLNPIIYSKVALTTIRRLFEKQRKTFTSQ